MIAVIKTIFCIEQHCYVSEVQSEAKDPKRKVWYLLTKDCPPKKNKKRSKTNFCLVI